jgi:hypothetical protein
VPTNPVQAEKFYTSLSDITKRKVQLPSDYNRTLIKAPQKQKQCGMTIPQLGTQQKQLQPLRVPTQKEQHATKFMRETGFTYAQVARQDDIPVAEVVGLPYEHGKPFVTKEEEEEEEEVNLGTQMFKFHRWYLKMLKEETHMFGVKYRDHDFFSREEDDFWVDIELMHAIYHQGALDISIIAIWVL